MQGLAARDCNQARLRALRLVVVLLLVFMLLPAASPADEKHVSVYAPVATYKLPLVERSGHEYVGLLELLEPLGRVSTTTDGLHWKLRYNAVDSEFTVGKTRAKVRGRELNLTAPFLMDRARGLVPVSSLNMILPQFLGSTINFRESARRLFIGNVAIQPSVQVDPANPGQLAFNFSAPVSPTISTEPGKLHMVFKRDPVLPMTQPLTFENKVITQVSCSESNGNVEFDVAANAPLMASFSNAGRTITVSTTQQSAASTGPQVQPAPATPSVPAPPSPVAGTAAPSGGATTSAAARRVFAVIDPAHGGDERGAALSDTIAEKNVTLGFARLLRHELEQRGFSVLLSRDSDVNVSLDQRAGAANAAHAGIFITLHAASQGTGIRVYTALLPVEDLSKGPFRAWNAAQAPALSMSRTYAAAIVSEMQKRQVPVRGSAASLRPMNNVLMPAVAVELAPGPHGTADLPSANYQQQIAAIIADALVPLRARLGAQP